MHLTGFWFNLVFPVILEQSCTQEHNTFSPSYLLGLTPGDLTLINQLNNKYQPASQHPLCPCEIYRYLECGGKRRLFVKWGCGRAPPPPSSSMPSLPKWQAVETLLREAGRISFSAGLSPRAFISNWWSYNNSSFKPKHSESLMTQLYLWLFSFLLSKIFSKISTP